MSKMYFLTNWQVSLVRISEVAVGVIVAATLVAFAGPLFSSPKVRDLDAEYLFKQDCLKRGGEIYEYAESSPQCIGAKQP